MNFIQNKLRPIEYGDYFPIAKYGSIYSDKIGKEKFTLSHQLLQGKKIWVLRLDLNRSWGSTGSRTLTDCHFHTLSEINTPIQQVLSDVKTGLTQPGVSLEMGAIWKWLMAISAGEVIWSYGRIDGHPRNEGRFRLELFLSWDSRQHWLVLREGEGSIKWSKWPIGIAESLDRLFPRLDREVQSSYANVSRAAGA